MEADRFQHLDYTPDRIQDGDAGRARRIQQEQRQPVQKLFEDPARDALFRTHTYKHTTMGFLADIQKHAEAIRLQPAVLRPLLPARVHHHHRGRRCRPKQVRALVDERWGTWKRGTYKADIPRSRRRRVRARLTWTGLRRRCPGWRSRSAGRLTPTTTDDTAALDAIAPARLRPHFAAFIRNS